MDGGNLLSSEGTAEYASFPQDIIVFGIPQASETRPEGRTEKERRVGNARFGRRRVVVAVDQGKPTATRDNEKRPRCFSLGTGLDSVAGKTSTARGEKKKPNFPISKAEGTHGWRRGEGKKGKGRKGE